METKIKEIKKEIKFEIEEIVKITEAKFSKDVQDRIKTIDLKIDEINEIINNFSSEVEKYKKLSDKVEWMNQSLSNIKENTINNPKFIKKFYKKS